MEVAGADSAVWVPREHGSESDGHLSRKSTRHLCPDPGDAARGTQKVGRDTKLEKKRFEPFRRKRRPYTPTQTARFDRHPTKQVQQWLNKLPWLVAQTVVLLTASGSISSGSSVRSSLQEGRLTTIPSLHHGPLPLPPRGTNRRSRNGVGCVHTESSGPSAVCPWPNRFTDDGLSLVFGSAGLRCR